MGGIEVIQQIGLLDRNAKIMVLTSAAGDIQARRAFQAGASAYLLKSSVQSELIEKTQLVRAACYMYHPNRCANGGAC